MATAGIRKAAVVLSSLPEKQAVGLLGQMTAAEAAAVRGEMAGLDRLGPRRRQAVLQEFAARATASHDRCETASGRDSSAFQLLHGMETEDLLALLADEHPQTVALVLSHLPADQAAKALGAMPPEPQAPLMRRIAMMDEPSLEIIRDVEEAIRRRLNGVESAGASIGMTSVVKMLGAMRPADQRRLLGEIAQADAELLGGIRQAMFGADVAGCETACG
jgi:flagellar motor switch protein FliG